MNTLDLSKLFRQISSVRRFSTVFLAKDENIAEHSCAVALLCYTIYFDVLNNTSHSLPANCLEDIDINLVMRHAILHDLDEIVTGDITRNTKYMNEEIHAAIDKTSTYAIAFISKVFGEHFNDINYKHCLNEKMASFIKAVDFLTVLYKIDWEISLGNNDIIDMCPEIIKFSNEIKSKNALCKHIVEKYMTPIFDKFPTANASLNFRVL